MCSAVAACFESIPPGCRAIRRSWLGLERVKTATRGVGCVPSLHGVKGTLCLLFLGRSPCREFRKWIPSVNTVVYVGDAQSREVGVAVAVCWWWGVAACWCDSVPGRAQRVP